MLIQNRPARLFLLVCFLTTSLVLPALSSRAHADPSAAQSAAQPPAQPSSTAQAEPLSEDELRALHLAFRGFVAVTLPGGIHNGCEGHEASEFVRRRHEFYRSWYTITIQADCIGRASQKAEIWFQCADRGSVTCTLSQPYEEPQTN